MAIRPRPTPPTPIPPDDTTEFARPEDYQTRAGGPEVFAQKTAGSKQIGGESAVKNITKGS